MQKSWISISNLALPRMRLLKPVSTRLVWTSKWTLRTLSIIPANHSQSISVLWISSWLVMTKGPYWNTVWSRGSPAIFSQKSHSEKVLDENRVYIPTQTEYRPSQLLVSRRSRRPHGKEQACGKSHNQDYFHRCALHPSRLTRKGQAQVVTR
jgi:hypothetical protein